MIRRNVMVNVEPKVSEIADEIWNMTSGDQILLLAQLDMRFFQIPASGESQLASMLMSLLRKSPAMQERIKHIVKALHQYLVEEDNSEIEESRK